MPYLKLISSFNAGELSPKLDARTDLDKYAAGCRRLENFVIMPYGGVNRRPGLEYLGEAKHGDKKCRLLDFNFSTETNFILEFGNTYVRFWSNGVQVESGGSPYEITSPYLEADLFAVQYIQINDIVYLVHPEYPPYKLSRLADDNWTLAAVAFDWPMMLDENITDTTIASSATTGTSVTLTASDAIFYTDHVGAYFEIAHRRDANFVEIDTDNNKTSSTIKVLGTWEIFTYGTWTAEILVQRSADGGTTWETIRTYRSKDDRNVAADGVEETEVLLRMEVKNWVSHTNATARLEVTDNKVYGLAKITAVSGDGVTTATADIENDLEATTATKNWSEGAWSERQGYPRTVVLHEQRIVYGGNKRNANMIWGSVSNDFENFRKGVRADQAYVYQIASKENNTINWLVSRNSILVGTSGDEWTFGSTNDNEGISPTNIKVRKQSAYGSKHIQATLVNEAVLFVQRKGRKVREFVYSFERDTFVAPDLTLLSEHITDGGIVQSAFQQQPDAILWTVTGGGTLAGMTYEREQNVVGWHRHTTDGEFESIAVIYGDSGDEAWCSVKRTINGTTKRYIERIDPDALQTQDNADKDNLFYVDSGKVTVLGSPGTSVTGLDHLEGESVTLLVDGATHPNKTVASGAVTLDFEGTTIVAGLNYESVMMPMKLNLDTQSGTGQGRHQKVHQITARLHKTLGGKFSDALDGDFDILYFRDTGDLMDDSPALFTGDKEIDFDGSFDEGGDLVLKQDQPFPMTVLGLIPKFDVFGG